MSSDTRRNSTATHLTVIGLCAIATGLGVNEALVWMFERHEPPRYVAKAKSGTNKGAPDAAHGKVESTPPAGEEPLEPLSDDAVLAEEVEDDPGDDAGQKEAGELEEDEPGEMATEEGADEQSRSERPEARRVSAGGRDDARDDARTFVVDKKALSGQIDNIEDVARDGRILPNEVDGERRGLKLDRVSPGGVFDELGLESGDVVRSVNGTSIDTQPDALDAAESMRDQTTFEVVLERDGERLHHRYLIRDDR